MFFVNDRDFVVVLVHVCWWLFSVWLSLLNECGCSNLVGIPSQLVEGLSPSEEFSSSSVEVLSVAVEVPSLDVEDPSPKVRILRWVSRALRWVSRSLR